MLQTVKRQNMKKTKDHQQQSQNTLCPTKTSQVEELKPLDEGSENQRELLVVQDQMA